MKNGLNYVNYSQLKHFIGNTMTYVSIKEINNQNIR